MIDFDAINQLIELKRQMSHLNADVKSLHVSFWEKSLPTIVGALVGGGISVLIFWLTQWRENKRHKWNEEKDYRLTIRRLYGQLAELSQGLIIELGTLNAFLCSSNYYTFLTTMEEDPDKIKELYERRKRQETLYYEGVSKASAITSKMTGIIYEYFFLNPKSSIMDHYGELMKHKYEVIQKEKYTNEMSREKLEETHKHQISYARSEVARTIVAALEPLLECILDENNNLKEKLEPVINRASNQEAVATQQNTNDKAQENGK